MNKMIIAMSTVSLMAIASLVSCNQTSGNQNDTLTSEQDVTVVEQADSLAVESEVTTKETANPTVREMLQNGAKTIVYYNQMEDELDIIMKYNGESYYIGEYQLTSKAVDKLAKDLYYADPDNPGTLKPTDVKPEVRLSDIVKQ